MPDVYFGIERHFSTFGQKLDSQAVARLSITVDAVRLHNGCCDLYLAKNADLINIAFHNLVKFHLYCRHNATVCDKYISTQVNIVPLSLRISQENT